MKSITTVCLSLLVVSNALPLLPSTLVGRQSTPALEQKTDQLLFDASIYEFVAARNAQDPKELIWTSNGCTSSPDKPLGYDFQLACYRHDFGYHNYREQGRFTEAAKDRIDTNFKEDLYDECDTHGTIGRAICRGIAKVYYEAVSAFGGDDATPTTA